MGHNISDKMYALTQKNSAIREMFEEGIRLKGLYGAENVFDFSLGNPNFKAPERVKSAIVETLEKDESTFIHGYMPNVGFADVRLAIANSLNSRFGTSYNENNLIMTVGAAGGLNVTLKTILNPEDEVICLAPYFLEYGNYINNYDGKAVIVPANIPSFQVNIEELEKAITAKTKAIIVNNPNNPSGVIYTEETIKKIGEILDKKQAEFGTVIYLISDEPYRELAYDGKAVPWIPDFYKNTIVCYSWSKSLSLPGERIGYLVIPSDMADYELLYGALGIANRVMGFVNAPSLLQRAVALCLDECTDIASYDKNRQSLYHGLKNLGFDCSYPDGTFYLWVKSPCDDKEFCTAAKKYNILMSPGSSFACPGYIRLAYCVAHETIVNSMVAFEKLAKDYNLK